MKVELQPAYLLSSRAYLESSLIVDMFAKDYGRIAMVARGAKRGKFSKFALLQPFVPLLISWQGSGNLYTMTYLEATQAPIFLTGRKLISGMYLNELLVRLLAAADPHLELFEFYQTVLMKLATAVREQEILRYFEKRLLAAIGYALPLIEHVGTGEQVLADQDYCFDLEHGPQQLLPQQCDALAPQSLLLKGRSLLALHAENLADKTALHDAKKLLRAALTRHLGATPLNTRKLLSSINFSRSLS